MAKAEVQNWLEAGIQAARSGRRDEAQSFLMRVVEIDERNEQGWLWLSGVVDDDADRRICLENVIAINPDHEAARRGLVRLQAPVADTAVSAPVSSSTEASAADEEIVVRREYAPHSLASAVLYPESQVKEWRYRDPVPLEQVPAASVAATSGYDDVWTRNVAICAYCATELKEEDIQCPRCGRRVWSKAYRYPQPGINMHILWVMLAAMGQLFLVHGLYHLIVEQVLLGAVLTGIMMLLFFGLAIGVYLRQAWAHLGAIIGSTLVLLALLFNALVPLNFSGLESSLQGVDPAIGGFLAPFAGMIGETIRILEMGAALLTLGTAVLGAASDFQKVDRQQTARLKRGVRFASDHHATAREFARRGMLATAVLHWQRAVGNAPNHPLYLRYLGRAYAGLGFYERSLDVLQSGLETANPEQKALLQQLIATVQRQQEAEEINE